ncbi:MAG: MFS transporter [Bacteroidales bacterium]|nr:MFS transporter [Bacteroidales bacterium]
MDITVKKKARIAITAEYFTIGFIFSTLLSRFPALIEKYQLSDAQLSFVPFSMSVGSLLCMPLCGYLLSKYGSKKISVVGYLHIGLLPLFALMPNMYFLYALCILFGVAMGGMDVAINTNGLLLERSYKRPIISLFHAFFYIGMACGSLLSILFLLFHASLLLHLSIISLITVVIFYFSRSYFLQETPKKTVEKRKRGLLLPKGILLLIALIAFCGRIIEGSISDWSTVYMNNIVQLSFVYAPIGLTIYAIFLSVGRFFGDRVRSTFRDEQTLFYSCLITSVGLAIMISTSGAATTIIGLFVSGLGLSNVVPVIYSLAGKATPESPGLGLATVNTISGTGFFFGPAIIGFIAEHYSLRVSFSYVLALCVVMSCLAYRYMYSKQQ